MRGWLEKMEKEKVLTPIKRGEAKNCKVEHDLIQSEKALKIREAATH